ncbi:hypothetical protein NXH76_26735 [Blautia schinkii]|nr:hypothetical protein [Blautia schinkii]
MNDIYFDNVFKIGKLYLEHILYEFEQEPILFLCTGESGDLYLCLCSDFRYGQKWIAVRCSLSTLKSLIDEEIDIVSAFIKQETAILITMDVQGNESSSFIDIKDVDPLDLPKEGTFVRCNKEKALNYLWKKELEVAAAILKTVMKPMLSSVIEIIKSYSSVFTASINISKELELYSNSLSENYAKMLNEIQGETMPVRFEYSVYMKDKYIEPVDEVVVDDINDDGYLEAA